MYKARQYEGNVHGRMTIGCACADQHRGPYRRLADEPLFPPERFHIEDPFVCRTESGYELIAKDMDGNLCGEKHGGIHAVSTDGRDWRLSAAAAAKSYSRTIRWDDGTVQTMGSLERPFVLFQDGEPTHLFAAVADGPGGFQSASHTWNQVIPIGREIGRNTR
jgi:hypothetical protein